MDKLSPCDGCQKVALGLQAIFQIATQWSYPGFKRLVYPGLTSTTEFQQRYTLSLNRDLTLD